MVYDNFQILRGKSYAKVSAEMMIEFDNAASEIYCIGTPRCWDEALSNQIDLNQYDSFHFLWRMEYGKPFNRVAERKAISKIQNLQGRYMGSYDTVRGHIYTGTLKKCGEETLGCCVSPIIALIPSGSEFPISQVFDIFSRKNYDFETSSLYDVVSDLRHLIPDSVWLQFCVGNNVSLEIWSDSVDRIVPVDSECIWERNEDLPVYRQIDVIGESAEKTGPNKKSQGTVLIDTF